MTSYYSKYLLNNTSNKPINNTKDVNILKKDFTMNYSDYEKLKINEQYNKLYSNIYEKNKENVQINENKKIYNLSLYELAKKSGSIYINLVNDLSIYFYADNKNKNINTLGYILTKDDNLLYIGILILILAFFLWLIQITS